MIPPRARGHGCVMTTATHLALMMSLAGGATPPEWIHILPAGTFSGADGRGPFRVAD
jgi:hypothetical protein